MKIIIPGTPITKKNSQQIIRIKGRPVPIPSKAFKTYEAGALKSIVRPAEPIATPVNVACVYYMPTRRKVDLCNLIEATCDILVRAGVLLDDNCKIVYSHDGSHVSYDKENPRAEVYIKEAK